MGWEIFVGIKGQCDSSELGSFCVCLFLFCFCFGFFLYSYFWENPFLESESIADNIPVDDSDDDDEKVGKKKVNIWLNGYAVVA